MRAHDIHTMKKRVNISIGAGLHAKAVEHAAAVEMDFSELVAHLLRTRLGIQVERDIGMLPRGEADVSALVANPSRTAPCPCGSGVKMKRCTCVLYAVARAKSS